MLKCVMLFKFIFNFMQGILAVLWLCISCKECQGQAVVVSEQRLLHLSL